jgi:polysaccharide export outer membrane protein
LRFLQSVTLSGVALALAGMIGGGVVRGAQDPRGQTSPANQLTKYVPPDSPESSSQPAKPKNSGSVANPSAPAEAAPTAPIGVSTSPSRDTYRVGVDDELQISVWREPELSAGVVVRPDGIITLPLVNDLNVVGQTPKELQTLLTEKLKPFVNEPQVTVIVRAIRSRKVYLMGQVPRPGIYPLSDRTTILQLLVMAGGMNAFAKSSSIYVLRRQNGQEIRIPFNFKRAIKGTPERDDVVLIPGDLVVVP